MKNSIKILIIISAILAFQSCKKKDTEDDNNQGYAGKIKAITISNTPLIDYTYSTNGNIQKQVIHQGNAQMIITYEYSDAKISSIIAKDDNGMPIYQYDLTYTNDKLDKYWITGASQTYWEMNYNNDGTVDYAILYTPDGNGTPQPTKKQLFSYDANKNITEAIEQWRFGSIWEQQSRYTFEYDSKNNPMKELHIPYSETMSEFANFISPNNAIREKEYGQNNTLIEDTQYQITYNADSYPIQIEDNHNHSYTITYY